MNRTPRPTEYRGIRFDSKLEAVFARMLDLNRVKWKLEHPVIRYGHQWDFELETPDFPNGLLIELKPSEPTETYIDQLFDIGDADVAFANPHAIIVYGNPWSAGFDGFICTNPWCHSLHMILSGYVPHDFRTISLALMYRFDLKQPLHPWR